MSDFSKIADIADDTRPNMGRIYDYLLGGCHNFEVDRAQAAKIVEKVPLLPKMLRQIRWFLGKAVQNLLADGYTQFLDFASGLPLQDHIHQIAPKGINVVYSDNDPITVAFAKEIIGDNPHVLYLRCDVANPTSVLEDDSVAALLDRNRKCAIGMNGITYFLEDSALARSLEILYNWANTGDRLYLCDADFNYSRPEDREVLEIYSKMGSPFYWHSVDKMKTLIGQWRPVSPGYRPLEDWLSISDTPLSFGKKEVEIHGGNLYGVILEK